MSAVQKAIASKRITPNPDGTIDPERANEEWESMRRIGPRSSVMRCLHTGERSLKQLTGDFRWCG